MAAELDVESICKNTYIWLSTVLLFIHLDNFGVTKLVFEASCVEKILIIVKTDGALLVMLKYK